MPYLLRGIFCGFQHRRTGYVRCRRSISPNVKRRCVGIGRGDNNVLPLHAQCLSGNLRQNCVTARSEVRCSNQKVEAAVIVDLNAGATHIQVWNCCSLHHGSDANTPPQVRLARDGMPGFITEPLIPFDGFAPFCNCLFQTNRMDYFWDRFAPLIPGGTEWLEFSWSNSVLQTEFNRVQVELSGDIFQVPVKRPISLGHAISAVGSGWRRVCVNNIGIKADVGIFSVFSITHVQTHGFLPSVACNGQRMAAIGACVREGDHLVGGDCTVKFHACFHAYAHRMP